MMLRTVAGLTSTPGCVASVFDATGVPSREVMLNEHLQQALRTLTNSFV